MRNYLIGLMMLALVATISPVVVAQADEPVGCSFSSKLIYPNPLSFGVRGDAVLFLKWINGDSPWGDKRVRVRQHHGRVRYLNAKAVIFQKANSPECKEDLREKFSRSDLPLKTVNELVRAGLAIRR